MKRTEGELVYFDHAATSFPKSAAVGEAILDVLRRAGGNPGRSGHPPAEAAADVIFSAREGVARLFGASVEKTVFTPGATFSLNMALSLYAKAGTRILYSDREHNAALRPALRLARERGCEAVCYPAGDLAAFRRLLGGASVAVAVHASNVTGELYDPLPFSRAAREAGVAFILDAAQTAGHIPVTLEGTGADVIGAPAHKALGGIAGAGVAVLREGEGLGEFLSGGSGSRSLAPEMPPFLPDRYEAGTPPVAAIAALGAAVKHLDGAALRRRGERLSYLVAMGRDVLRALPATRLLPAGDGRMGILAFTLGEMPSEEVAARLGAAGICVRGGLHCAPLAHRTLGTLEGGAVRISFGEDNTEEEIRRMGQVLETMG
jgi:selenocysteine lyase/cysteine desulfurase